MQLSLPSLTSALADALDPPQLRYRNDPVKWAEERAGVELWSKQKDIMMSVVQNPNTAVKSCHSAGKGLWVDTPLPTPTGWVRMGDIQLGDTLYDEVGQPTRVIAVSEVRYLDCYRVTFTDGSSLVADADHLWNVLTMSQRRQLRGQNKVYDWRDHWASSKTVNTCELLTLTQVDRGNKPGIPLAQALKTSDDDVSVLIPPYILGVWLGDGCSHNATISNHQDDDEICQHIRDLGWETFRSERNTISVRLRPPTCSMASLLRTYDLIKNKHIPAVYLRASYAQRLELLRGLMDTDGSIDGRSPEGRGSATVGFKSERLARQTYELIRSLGWRATWRTRRAKLYDKDCGEFYCITFTSSESPFHLPRKTERWKPCDGKWTINTVRNIERVPTVPTRCISVDSPRSLYLAGEGMHVTHNSYISALVVCWWLDVHPPGEARAITTAPTSKQVDAILWYEIGRFHRKIGLVGQCNLREWYIGRQLIALGRKPPDHQEAAFQGLHAKYLLAVLDEAYGIPKNLWDEASSLASNEYGRQLAIGNPDGPGEFMSVCEKDTSWNTIHIGYQHTPAFTGEKVSSELKLHLVSKRWVDERAEKWGRQSALFQSKCGGNFPTGGDPFSTIPYDMATRCQNLEFPEGEPYEGGVDVGGGGDRTVLRERRGLKAGREFEFLDSDPMRSVGIVAEKIKEWGLRRVKVDSTGLGWGFAGRLKELSSRQNPTSTSTTHDAEIIPVNFGAGPPPGFEKKFTNMRAYLWWNVGRELSRLQAWDLSDVEEDVIHELTTSRYIIMDSFGKIKIEPKKDIIKRLGFSPDRAEALILSFYEVKREAQTQAWSAWSGVNGESLTNQISPTDQLFDMIER